MNIILDNIFSIFIYLSSFSIIAYLISINGRALSKWKRASLVLIASLIILGIAALELPLYGIPFWSRDFSLTWQLMVLCFAIITSSFHLTLKGIKSSNRPFFLGQIRERIRFSKINRENEVGEINEPARSRISLNQYLANNGTGMPRNRAYLLISIGVVLLVAYLIGAHRQLLLNRDIEATDQSAYMNYAKDMAITDYSHVGGRNRMPLYPFLQSFLYSEDIEYSQFFLRGKYFNLILSVFLLIVLSIILMKYFKFLWAAAIVLVTAFSVFIFKAGWFQTELLFYLLNFILFLLMLEYLVKPSLEFSVWIGIAAGYAHLTKASILPGLIILLLIIFVMNIRRILIVRNKKEKMTRRNLGSATVIEPLLIILFFILVTFPYIKNSWYRFGTPLYNVNSTFYFWYDSWEEVKAGTRAYGDREGWPTMPEEEIPSVRKYLAEHDIVEISTRITNGARGIIKNVINSYGYHRYVGFLIIAVILGFLLQPANLKQCVWGSPRLVYFLILYFVSYSLLYSWWAPITRENRLILGQFLPFVFILASTVTTSQRGVLLRLRKLDLPYSTVVAGLLMMMLIVDIWFILTKRIFMYGGG